MNSTKIKSRTCNGCGWVYFGITRNNAEISVKQFNAFYKKLTKKEKANYGNKKASIKEYEHCGICGEPWTNFRDSKEGDCPDGSTLNPIISD